MGVRELLLVRHGESQGNVAASDARAAGAQQIDVPARDADVDLSPLGQRQARAIGGSLAAMAGEARPQALVVSPYLRARETARLACAEAGLDLPTRIDERLRDRELGVLDRLTFEGVQARFPEEAERRRWQGKFYHRPAGGESWVDVALRLRSWLAELDRASVPDRLLVVSHDVVIALLRYVCEDLDEEQVLELARDTPLRNASLSRLVRATDGAGRSRSTTRSPTCARRGSRSPSTRGNDMSGPELVTPELLRGMAIARSGKLQEGTRAGHRDRRGRPHPRWSGPRRSRRVARGRRARAARRRRFGGALTGRHVSRGGGDPAAAHGERDDPRVGGGRGVRRSGRRRRRRADRAGTRRRRARLPHCSRACCPTSTTTLVSCSTRTHSVCCPTSVTSLADPHSPSGADAQHRRSSGCSWDATSIRTTTTSWKPPRRYSCCVTAQAMIADPDGQSWRVPSGHPGLATAGSGDVLAGLVVGLLARDAEPAQAACWGTYLHSMAGERLASTIGGVGFLARELVDQVPPVLLELS